MSVRLYVNSAHLFASLLSLIVNAFGILGLCDLNMNMKYKQCLTLIFYFRKWFRDEGTSVSSSIRYKSWKYTDDEVNE